MSFSLINIKSEYRTLNDDITKDFFIPLLSNATCYKRAVGFFSSTSLIQISKGIIKFIQNGGKMQLIASPRLSEEDIEAINKGYKIRQQVIENALLQEIAEPKSYFEAERLNILASLIANGSLDIKIAFTKSLNKIGIYHEKMGLIYDRCNDVVAFSGSINETETAFIANYEAMDVYCSWKSDFEKKKIMEKETAFEKIWNNLEHSIEVIEFPKIVSEKFQKYKKDKIDFEIDNKEFPVKLVEKNKPVLPFNFKFHDYQKEAIKKWVSQGCIGVYDMATGTGKTYTALGSILELYEFCNSKLAVIICCPFQHLVEQWVEDIKLFNINPIIGYSNSPQKNWLKKLSDAILNQKLNVKGCKFFCFICTNATYASLKVQEIISKISCDALFIADEAHYFGAQGLSSKLLNNFKYRLALSATLERHYEDDETKKLYKYFGEKCIEYDLKRAIKEKKLTPYKYYPIIVNLSEDELEKYNELSFEISKCIIIDNKGKIKLNEYGKILAQQRARLVAGANAKIIELKNQILNYKDDTHILVYCGATNLLGSEDDFTTIDECEIRQIDCITKLLGNELKMKVSQFTSKEDINERQILKKQFEKGEYLQVLIAIKCLDEGVNIPKIKTAFILASTTNPKEYIQRRGRVLRLAEGKNYAEIFDFITLPRPLDEVYSHTIEELKYDLSLVNKEIKRIEEFSKLARNSTISDSIIQEIKSTYNIKNLQDLEEEFSEEI